MQLRELHKYIIQAAVADAHPALLNDVTSGDIDAATRIAAYKNNVYAGLFNALKDTYPTVAALVHDDFFRGIVHDYVNIYPPTAASLDDYGAEIPAFLCKYAPTQHLAYLPDVAKFDWCIHRCSIADDDIALNPSILQQLGNDVAENRFALRSGVKLMHSQYPLDAIWRLCREPENSKPFELEQRPRFYLIYRCDDFSVWFEEISEAHFTMLKNLEDQQTLYEAAQHAFHLDSDFDMGGFFVHAFACEVLRIS
jgi:hypothetical protein